MKIYIFFLIGFCLLSFAADDVFAQQKNQKLTIILLRHAEKDKEQEAQTLDPSLSDEGERRAERLSEILDRYKPDAVFSSQFRRTFYTAAPYANGKRRMMVQFYDHKDLSEIARIAREGKFRRIVIVGHNTTTPALANLLIGEQKYKFFKEDEYDKIIIIEVEKRKGEPDSVKDEIISY
jgi:2,3-bisphosphoglycerate-dependent phosphoglycerate mutase